MPIITRVDLSYTNYELQIKVDKGEALASPNSVCHIEVPIHLISLLVDACYLYLIRGGIHNSATLRTYKQV